MPVEFSPLLDEQGGQNFNNISPVAPNNCIRIYVLEIHWISHIHSAHSVPFIHSFGTMMYWLLQQSSWNV